MFNLFKKKRTFPNDWSNLSQEESAANIEYLLKNYKKHRITFLGEGRLSIDNVHIHQENKKILYYDYNVYVVNNRMFTIDSDVGQCISKLIYYCRHSENEKDWLEKLEEFWKNHKLDMSFVLVIIAVAVMCIAIVHLNEKNKKQKQKQQEQFEKIFNQKNQQIKTLKIANIMNQKIRVL